MGYSLRTLHWLVDLHQRGHLGAGTSVVELGSQDVMADPITAMACLRDLIGFECPEGALVTPRLVFGALGYTEYECIDTDGRHGALVMDLNADLEHAHGFTRTFDLVTDTGTVEHVFDQRQALANAHALCAPGGVMLHLIPTQGWVNHGYYSYEPCLFLDLAAANHYELLALDLDVGRSDGSGWIVSYVHGQSDPRSLAAQHEADVLILVALRKTSPEPLRTPFDSHYLEVNKVADAYVGQELSDGVPSLYHADVFQPWSAHRDVALMSGRQLLGEVRRRLMTKLFRRAR